MNANSDRLPPVRIVGILRRKHEQMTGVRWLTGLQFPAVKYTNLHAPAILSAMFQSALACSAAMTIQYRKNAIFDVSHIDSYVSN